MKLTIRQLRGLIRETIEAPAPIDDILPSMQAVDKKIQAAHAAVTTPEAQVMLVGMHQDLFQLISDFRGYVRQIKSKS